jgi:hypothetical protein
MESLKKFIILAIFGILLYELTVCSSFILQKTQSQTVFGVGIDYINFQGGLKQMSAANISWTRPVGVLWSSVESRQGIYDWAVLSELERELRNASRHGIQVILLVHSTPEWARKIPGEGPSCGPIAPDQLSAFGKFMQSMVARYSFAPYNVNYWEIWNEPDTPIISGDRGFGCWGDASEAYFGGEYYAEMLKAVYPQIKKANPQAQVLVGGLLLDCDPRLGAGCTKTGKDTLPPKFMEGILRNDGADYFDGVSFHAYDFYRSKLGEYGNSTWQSAWNTSGPALIEKTKFIRDLFSANGVTDKFLLNTELGLLCDRCENDPIFETTKAYYIAQSYAAAMANGLRANLWYNVFGWRNSGLLHLDFKPLPAYKALLFSRKKLGDAKFIGDITPTEIGGISGVKGYKFQRGDRRVWLLWSLDGIPHEISVAVKPIRGWDALGVSILPLATMTVSVKPLYLEWSP